MIFRRKGLRLAPWYATLALFWAFSATFALAFFVAVFKIRPLHWSDLWVIALIGAMAWPPDAIRMVTPLVDPPHSKLLLARRQGWGGVSSARGWRGPTCLARDPSRHL
jgi:hypothetical protein